MATKSQSDKKLYRNAGVTHLVIEGEDIAPGDEFRAQLSPEFEMQMFTGGHLELLQDQSRRADEAQAQAAEESETPAGGTVEAVESPTRNRRRS